MAQKIYDESEDHYAKLKAHDANAAEIFVEAMDKLTKDDGMSDEQINKIVADIQERVKDSKNPYFVEQFPQLFN